MLVEVWCGDSIHTERASTTSGLNCLVEPSESCKSERIVGNSTHDPISEGLVHGIAKVEEEVKGGFGSICVVGVVKLGDDGAASEGNLPRESTRPDDNYGKCDDTEAKVSTGSAIEARSIENEETDDKGTEDSTETFEGGVQGA